jgi:hypothetical protein
MPPVSACGVPFGALCALFDGGARFVPLAGVHCLFSTKEPLAFTPHVRFALDLHTIELL